jgi:hypothetical protein
LTVTKPDCPGIAPGLLGDLAGSAPLEAVEIAKNKQVSANDASDLCFCMACAV